MKSLPDILAQIAVTLWIGGLWAIGYLVAPALFSALPDDRMLAGVLAGRMFTLIAYVGMACGIYLLIYRFVRFGTAAFKQGVLWILLAMLILTAAGHFGIQPVMVALKSQALPADVMHSVFKDRFATWHGVSSVVYLIESLLGVGVVLLNRGK
ncbi:MAG: DUF4149 domain-containing protein [Sulfuricella sp.]|nr:DUF4149 domain-containing protein [Sulfuricella sp.]